MSQISLVESTHSSYASEAAEEESDDSQSQSAADQTTFEEAAERRKRKFQLLYGESGPASTWAQRRAHADSDGESSDEDASKEQQHNKSVPSTYIPPALRKAANLSEKELQQQKLQKAVKVQRLVLQTFHNWLSRGYSIVYLRPM